MTHNPHAISLFRPQWGMKQVEDKAGMTLERCRHRLGLETLPLPIPVEDWIEGPLGIELGFHDLSHLGDNVLGAAHIDPPEIQISEALIDQEPRLRFTCAHELGHLMLHAKLANQFADNEVEAWSNQDRVERQADRFAAAFLMPTALLFRELYDFLGARGFDTTLAVSELMLDTPESAWLWKKHVLPSLTERFAVSLTALLLRFGDFTLPDGKPFLLPIHRTRLSRPASELHASDPLHALLQSPAKLTRLRAKRPRRMSESNTQHSLFSSKQ